MINQTSNIAYQNNNTENNYEAKNNEANNNENNRKEAIGLLQDKTFSDVLTKMDETLQAIYPNGTSPKLLILDVSKSDIFVWKLFVKTEHCEFSVCTALSTADFLANIIKPLENPDFLLALTFKNRTIINEKSWPFFVIQRYELKPNISEELQLNYILNLEPFKWPLVKQISMSIHPMILRPKKDPETKH